MESGARAFGRRRLPPEVDEHIAGKRWLRGLRETPFVLPLVLIIGFVTIVPAIIAIVHSFTNWSPGYASPFVGLRNYTNLFKSTEFQQVLKNEGWLLLGIPIWIVVPLGLALLLHRNVPAAGFFRSVYFFPATASPALLGLLFTFIFGPEGPLNSILRGIGLGSLQQNWLQDPTLVKPILIVVLLWATLGTGTIIFSAGLSAIPQEQFEAADLDGASWVQQLRYVMIPGLRGLIELWAVILVVNVFTQAFPWVYTLTHGGPGYASTTMDYDIYSNALDYGAYGTAAAEMVILLLIVTVLLVTGRLISRNRA
jgi:ABC-type sugar transport system permease subunit